MIAAWILFPLVLALIGLGWGAIVERAAGVRLPGALLLPTGLAGALVVAGTITGFPATAKAATPVVAVGAAGGILLLLSRRRFAGWRGAGWPALAALGVLLAYGAPVLLSGEATFTGYVKLDDTGTWFNVIDHVMAHARSVSGEPTSTFSLVFTGDVGASYPLGAFVLPGVARALVAQDIAWVFQPYLACCAGALALCLYSLMAPLIRSPRLRALAAFIAAQSALLYGYSLWGGIKEMTAAFLLALGVALAAALLQTRPPGWRELVPLGLAAGALIQVLGPGAGGFIVPALALLAVWWLARNRGGERRGGARALAQLTGLVVVCIVPVWLVVGDFFSDKGGLFAGLFSSGQSQATRLGNLLHPLSVFQLAGIWPVRDFRLTPPTAPSTVLITLAVLCAAAGLWASVRARRPTIALYLGTALVGCGAFYLAGSTPWVVGKTLAIASPALPASAMCGLAVLWSRGARLGRLASGAIALALAGGVLWSNVLGYGDVTLAPRPQMAELAHIGTLLAGKGPTLVNQYEIYADRHFLRAGAPVEPAEYRVAGLPLRDGAVLTKGAQADLDAFPLSTLEPYRSLVIPRSPTESRPPSSYELVWQGRYYELWQRRSDPPKILEHIPLGESNTLPFCGHADNHATMPLCSLDPVATPPCAQIEALGRRAQSENGVLLAYQRPAPIVARGDQTLWPASWLHYSAEHTIVPTTPGRAIAHIEVAGDQSYEVWLGGAFSRGFRVSVDGHHIGTVKNDILGVGGYAPVGQVRLSRGIHTFALEYPPSSVSPGSAENELTSLAAIALEPREYPPSELLSVVPGLASHLCGRPLDWVEIVSTS